MTYFAAATMAPLQRIWDIAEAQWGLFTLRQARDAGVHWRSLTRLAEGGRVERVAHGVYRIRGGAQPDHLALRAAWLQLDPDEPAWERLDDPDVAVVSHSSAASLFEVGDLRPDVHEFTLPRRRQTRRADVRLHLGRVPQDERVLLHGLPTTRAGRMIADLLGDNIDPDAVAQITAEVLDHTYEDARVVVDMLAPYARRLGAASGDGVAVLENLLERVHYRHKDEVLAEATKK